jgi:hypothetical protein
VRQQVDADAERPQLGDRLVHDHVGEAGGVEAQRGGQSPDPGAGDRDTHGHLRRLLRA